MLSNCNTRKLLSLVEVCNFALCNDDSSHTNTDLLSSSTFIAAEEQTAETIMDSKTNILPKYNSPFTDMNTVNELKYEEEQGVNVELLQVPKVVLTREDVDDIKIGPVEIRICKIVPCSSCYAKWEKGLLFLLNNGGAASTKDLYKTVPKDFVGIKQNVSVLRCIPTNIIFGPYAGLQSPSTGNDSVDNMRLYNWLQFVPFSTDKLRCNLRVFQFNNLLYFRTIRYIACNEKLVAHLDEQLVKDLSNDSGKYYYPTEEDIPHVYACIPCCLGFKSARYLRKHTINCINHRKKSVADIIPCRRCEIVSCSIKHHNLHRFRNCVSNKSETHTTNEYKCPEAYKCTMCDAIYKRKANFEKHVDAHENGKRYSCQRCNFKTNRRGCLTSHATSKHGIDPRTQTKTFKCKICYEEFIERAVLTVHMRAVHVGKKPYECQYCGLKYAWPESLSKHIRIHTREKLHTCQICKRDFVERRLLKKHVNTHFGQGYPCSKCHYRAATLDILNSHVERIHATLY